MYISDVFILRKYFWQLSSRTHYVHITCTFLMIAFYFWQLSSHTQIAKRPRREYSALLSRSGGFFRKMQRFAGSCNRCNSTRRARRQKAATTRRSSEKIRYSQDFFWHALGLFCPWHISHTQKKGAGKRGASAHGRPGISSEPQFASICSRRVLAGIRRHVAHFACAFVRSR